MPREVVLIGPLGISGGLDSDIVLGFLEVTFTRSENSLIKDVMSSDNSANSKNFSCSLPLHTLDEVNSEL